MLAGVRRYVACVRYREFITLVGCPFLGAVLAIGDFGPAVLPRVMLLIVADLLLLAHIFSFNDWADRYDDANDPNKSQVTFEALGLTPSGICSLSLWLGTVSLVLFGWLGFSPLMIAVTIAGASLAYSHPRLGAKRIPLVSSLVHLFGGLLHFLLGYSAFRPVDGRGVAIGVFFAVVFVAGHLHQELRDHESDRRNSVATNAVRFGCRRVFVVGQALFAIAYGLLVLLALTGYLPRAVLLLSLLYPAHLLLAVRAWRQGLSFEVVGRLQTGYRVLYALTGVAMLATLLTV